MLAKLWRGYLKIWPELVKTNLRLYSILIALGSVMFFSAVWSRSWFWRIGGWAALLALIMVAMPEYFIPWDED